MYKIELTGNSNDLYYISEDEKTATIRLIDTNNDSNISLELVSQSDIGNHDKLKQFLGKKIVISISVIE